MVYEPSNLLPENPDYQEVLEFLVKFKKVYFSELPSCVKSALNKLIIDVKAYLGVTEGAAFIRHPNRPTSRTVEDADEYALEGFRFFVLLESNGSFKREITIILLLLERFNISCRFLGEALKSYEVFLSRLVNPHSESVTERTTNVRNAITAHVENVNRGSNPEIDPAEFDRGPDHLTPVICRNAELLKD
jgi:hypothetical protein